MSVRLIGVWFHSFGVRLSICSSQFAWGGIQIKRPGLHSHQVCLLNSDIVLWFAEGFGVMPLLSNRSQADTTTFTTP